MSHFYLPRFIQERLAIVEGIGGIFWFVEIFARLRLRFITEVCFLGHCLIHRGLSWCWVIDTGWSLEFLPQGVWNGTHLTSVTSCPGCLIGPSCKGHHNSLINCVNGFASHSFFFKFDMVIFVICIPVGFQIWRQRPVWLFARDKDPSRLTPPTPRLPCWSETHSGEKSMVVASVVCISTGSRGDNSYHHHHYVVIRS